MKRLLLLNLFLCIGCTCNECPDNALTFSSMTATKVSEHEGFDVPECCLYHKDSDQVFVSNIACAPDKYWEDDSKGHIGRYDFAFSKKDAKWVNSSPQQIIHAPKGMTALGEHIYFTDNSRLMRCDVNGKNTKVVAEGFENANDLASDGKSIWLSDTQTGKVYCIHPDGEKREIPSPEAVNGVTCHEGKVFAVSWGLHEVYELDPAGKNQPVSFGLSEHFKNLDAIEVLGNGVFLVSDFMGNKISIISPDRKTVKTLIDIESPADVGIDRDRNLLFVPSFMKNKVEIYQLN